MAVSLFLFYDAAQFAHADGERYVDETRQAFEHFVLGDHARL